MTVGKLSPPVLTLFALIITCKASGNLLTTIPFRSAIHHHCSTFPIQQETAVRDVSRPVAGDAKGQSEGGDWTGQLSDEGHYFPLRSQCMVEGLQWRKDWRQGQEMEQDIVDRAISHRMLGKASLTKG